MRKAEDGAWKISANSDISAAAGSFQGGGFGEFLFGEIFVLSKKTGAQRETIEGKEGWWRTTGEKDGKGGLYGKKTIKSSPKSEQAGGVFEKNDQRL